MKQSILGFLNPRRSTSRPSNRKHRRRSLAKSLRMEQLEERRVFAAGALDPSFDGDGRVVDTRAGAEILTSIAIQPSDNKIVAVGISDLGANGKFAIVRYNPDGSLDTSFGTGGRVDVNFTPGNDQANDVAIQPDGKIVVVGQVSSGGLDSAILRLNTDGTLDTSFNGTGSRVFSVSSSTDAFLSVAIDTSGRIVATGNALVTPSNQEFTVARFLSDGSNDTSFNGSGLLTGGYTATATNSDTAEDVALDGLGNIVIAGRTQAGLNQQFGLARITTTGAFDSALDSDGRVTTSFTGFGGNTATDSQAFSLALQPDGDIVLVGSHNSRFAIARYLSDGSLDPTFGIGGRQQTLLPSTSSSSAQFVDVQENNKIVAVGFASSATRKFFAVTRYTDLGVLDTSFDTDGVVLTEFNASATVSDQALTGAIQLDGNIIAAGYVGTFGALDFALARYEGDPIPPDAGGPYFVAESGSVVLSATAPNIAPPPPVFEWDLDGDSIYGETGPNAERGDEVGANPTFSAVGYDGPSTYTVSLRVTDIGQPVIFDTAVINVTNVNPAANNDTATTNEEQSVSVNVLANDTDAAGLLDPLTITAVTNGTKGTASITAPGVITYVPNINESGTDTITYTVSDGDGGIATASVTITILNLVDFAGRLYDDANNDGLFNTLDGDAGLGGVSIEVVDQLSSVIIASGVTQADGSYNINANALTGQYRLQKAANAASRSLLDGQESAGNIGGTVDNSLDNETITDIPVGAPGTTPDAVDYLFAEIKPSSITGFVWKDFNDDSLIDFNEQAISGVDVTLTGTDDRGNAITALLDTTGVDGSYGFGNLRPGTYAITQAQPTGFIDSTDVVGTVNAVTTGTAGNDVFTGVAMPTPNSSGQNYNFAERPLASGSVKNSGQTASIGFWQNRRGQRLIESLNGGPNATQLGDWLAATFPNMYGANSGNNNLEGRTNAEVADYYRSLFRANRLRFWGSSKLEVQVMATALAVYVTNFTLAGNTATAFGFNVTTDGLGTRTFNVRCNGSAFGVANFSNVQVLNLLLAVDARTTNGLMYDLNGDGDVRDTNERCFRELANEVFDAINDSDDC